MGVKNGQTTFFIIVIVLLVLLISIFGYMAFKPSNSSLIGQVVKNTGLEKEMVPEIDNNVSDINNESTIIYVKDNSPPEEVVCNSPYIRVGRDCCLDKNSNSICDNDETKEEAQKQQVYIGTTSSEYERLVS